MLHPCNWLLPAAIITAISAAIIFGMQTRNRGQQAKPELIGGLECGHWAVFRVCELMGIPVTPKFLLEKMPSGARGHSLKEIADVLDSAGLVVRGRQESFDTFLASDGIRVLHISSPEHFIVVLRSEGGRVLFLDHRGRRQSLLAEQLRSHWSGNLLYVERPPINQPLGFDRDQVVENHPRVQFETLFIDKRDLPTRSDSSSVTFDFPFRNMGKADLLIKKVHTTCTCLKSRTPEQPIRPGESGTITLEYTLKNSPAVFHHEAVVETNDPSHPALILRAAGNANVLVAVNPETLNLGNVSFGTEHLAFFFIKYTGDNDFEVQVDPSTIADLTLSTHRTPKGELANQLWPGSSSLLDLGTKTRIVEVRFCPQRLGPIKGEITIHTNVERFEKISVPVIANGVPPVSINPPLLSFGELAPEEMTERTVLITSIEKKPIKVIDVTCNGEQLDWAVISSDDDLTNRRIRFAGKASRFQQLSGSTLRVKLTCGDVQFIIDLPVFAAKKKGS